MQIIENLSEHFTLSLSLSLFLVIEWIISCQGPWNHTPNPELPFLLASKIFIRTIRSSDKASTEGWGACGREGMVCQQDVCSATLYTETCPHQSETQPPSFYPVRPGCQGKMALCQLTPSLHPGSQQALLCPRPWAGGVGHKHAQWEEGGTRASWLLHELTHRSHCTGKQGPISALQPAMSKKNAGGGLMACGFNDL